MAMRIPCANCRSGSLGSRALPVVLMLLLAVLSTSAAIAYAKKGATAHAGARDCKVAARYGMPVKLAVPRDGVVDAKLSSDAPNVPLDGTIKVSPTIIAVPAQKAESQAVDIIIRNRRPTTTVFDLSMVGLVGTEAAGRHFDVIEKSDPQYNCTGGIAINSPAKSVMLKPRGVATVTFDIYNDSLSHRPLPDRFGAISITPQTPDLTANSTQVSVKGRILIPVLLHGAAKPHHDLRLADVRAPWLISGHRHWRIDAVVRNRGTVYEQPVGTVTVRTPWNSVVTRLPLKARIVLPGGSADTHVDWRGTPWLGIYRVETRVHPDKKAGPSGTSSRWLIVLPPWWAIVAFFASLVALVWWWRHDLDDADDDADSDVTVEHDEMPASH